MKTYAIVCKQDQESITLSEKLKEQLNTFLTYNEKEPDIVISVGGDGTMLYSVHKYIDAIDRVAFIGIHTGTLGFLTDYQRDEYLQLVLDINDRYAFNHRVNYTSCLENVTRISYLAEQFVTKYIELFLKNGEIQYGE